MTGLFDKTVKQNRGEQKKVEKYLVLGTTLFNLVVEYVKRLAVYYGVVDAANELGDGICTNTSNGCNQMRCLDFFLSSGGFYLLTEGGNIRESFDF